MHKKNYWSLGLALIVIGTGIGAVLLVRPLPAEQSTVVAAEPEVLGASTVARGVIPDNTAQHAIATTTPDVSTITADAFLVYDAANGETLLQKNSELKYSIASLTKLMTAYVTYTEGDLSKSVVITPQDRLSVNPSLGVLTDDVIGVHDLFNAMLIGSANDAAKTLSNHIASSTSDFIAKMNSAAQELGMYHTNYSNALGFDSDYNFSTAADLQKLVMVTQNIAAFTNLGKRTEYTFTSALGNPYKVLATNKLVKKDPEVEAIKTGNTPLAKGALISKITHDGHSIVVIVLSSYERENDVERLKKLVFDNFEWE